MIMQASLAAPIKTCICKPQAKPPQFPRWNMMARGAFCFYKGMKIKPTRPPSWHVWTVPLPQEMISDTSSPGAQESPRLSRRRAVLLACKPWLQAILHQTFLGAYQCTWHKAYFSCYYCWTLSCKCRAILIWEMQLLLLLLVSPLAPLLRLPFSQRCHTGFELNSGWGVVEGQCCGCCLCHDRDWAKCRLSYYRCQSAKCTLGVSTYCSHLLERCVHIQESEFERRPWGHDRGGHVCAWNVHISDTFLCQQHQKFFQHFHLEID